MEQGIYASIDRFSRQTVNIADELVQSASMGILGRGGDLGYFYPAICRVVEILCCSTSDTSPDFHAGYSSLFQQHFAYFLFLHGVRALIVSKVTSKNNDWLALVIPRIQIKVNWFYSSED